MKIDDVSLTIFTWDNIPATRYHLGALASSSSISVCCASTPTPAWKGTPSWARPPTRPRWTGRS
jgi:hypothetical protein